MATKHPATRPANPRFSSGPCAKIPHFELEMLADAPLGRSHRAKVGKDKLKAAIEGTREVLGIPADYKIGIVPASDTGAVEMAMWSMLGDRKATMVAWESFGSGWVTDVVKQLKIDAEVKTADYGEIVDFARKAEESHFRGALSHCSSPPSDSCKARRRTPQSSGPYSG